MLNKCTLLSLFFVALFSVLLAASLGSSSARATPTPVPVCTNDGIGRTPTTINLNTWDWQASVKEKWAALNPSLAPLDFATGSYLIQGQNGSYDQFYILYSPTKLKLYVSNDKQYVTSESPFRYFFVSGNISHSTAYTTNDWSFISPPYLITDSMSCVYGVKNVIYDSTWSASGSSPLIGVAFQPDQPVEEKCDVWDFPCWIGNIFDGIGDGFNNVSQAILQGFTHLFVPNENAMSDIFSSMQSFFAEKFGFLSDTIAFGGNLFSALTNTYKFGDWTCTSPTGGGQNCGYIGCNVRLGSGNLFGSYIDINPNICFIQQANANLWNSMIVILRSTVAIGLIIAFYYRYVNFVKDK